MGLADLRAGRLERTLRRLAGGDERGRILGNALWLYLDKAGRLLVSLLVGLWVARHLGPSGWGRLSYAAAFVALLVPLAAMGLDTLVLRDLSERPGDEDRILGSALWLRGGSALLALAAALAWSVWTRRSPAAVLVAVTAVGLLSAPLDALDLWFQARRRSRDSVLARIPSWWLASALRVGLIVLNAPLASFAAVGAFESLAGAAGVAWALRRARGSLPLALDRAEALALARGSLPLLLTGLSIMVYMRIDMVMLHALAGAAQTGVYAAATRLSELWYFVPAAFVGSAAPALYEAHRADAPLFWARLQRTMDFSAAMGLAFGAGVWWAAPRLVRVLYGAPYAGAAPMLEVHAWSGLFVCLGLAQSQWWNVARLNGVYLLSTALGAALNVALNALWMPRFGGLGAAWATLIAYAFSVTAFPCLWGRSRRLAWMQLKALAFPLRAGSLLKEAGWR